MENFIFLSRIDGVSSASVYPDVACTGNYVLEMFPFCDYRSSSSCEMETNATCVSNHVLKTFPFCDHRRSGSCETETNCKTVCNLSIPVPTCRIDSNKLNINDGATNDSQTIGNTIVNQRLSLNMTAVQLSNLSGVNVSTISRYENGKFSIENVKIPILIKLSTALGLGKCGLLNDYLIFKLFHIEILTAYIEEKQISKKKLAAQLNVSDVLVYNWFNKKERCPSYSVWQTAFKDFSLRWINENVDII